MAHATRASLELQARGELRAADLATRFEVSLRTSYRDLEGLAEGGVPRLATPGKLSTAARW